MDLVMMIVVIVLGVTACLIVLGNAVIDYQLREMSREIQLDLRCMDVMIDFLKRKP